MRTAKLRLLVLPFFGLLLGAGVFASGPQWGTDTVETHPVTDKIAYLVGGGGNVGVMVGEDGVLLVDDLFAQHAENIEKAVAALGGEGYSYLVNTHHHGDHTGGNEHFGQKATLVSHTNVRKRLDPGKPGALPVITHEAGMSIHVNGEEVVLLHFGPGHTDGDTVVWFTGSNVVHMGDLFFNVGYPFIDLNSGGDVEGMIDSVRTVLDLVPDDAKVIPGHGEVTDPAGLTAYVEMIEDCLARVRKAVGEGKPVGPDLVADYNERWGGFAFITPEKWVGTLETYVKR